MFSLGLASDTHGPVYEAFDPESGELRVVKVVELKSESAGELLQSEMEMLKQYSNTRDLVRQYGWCNSNWDSTPKVKKYLLNTHLVQRKGKAFRSHCIRNSIITLSIGPSSPKRVMSPSQHGQPRGSPVANAPRPAAKDLSSRQHTWKSLIGKSTGSHN